MGKRIETEKFDPKHLSFYKLIHEINLFVDSIPKPITLTEKEKKRIVSYRKESYLSDHNNFINIRFGIEIGEKIDKSVMTSIFIRDKYSMIPIIEILVENYSDRSFVIDMLPMKAIATVIDSDEQTERTYIKLLALYKMFGMKFIKNLLEYFDLKIFFKNFMTSTLCYLKRVERHMEELSDDNRDWSSNKIIRDILQELFEEGRDLKCLFETLIKEYPEMFNLEAHFHSISFQANEALKWIENALCDVEDMLEVGKK